MSTREFPSVPHRPPQFNTRTTPFQHPESFSLTPKPLSSTPKTPQFNTFLSSTPKTEKFWCGTEGILVLN